MSITSPVNGSSVTLPVLAQVTASQGVTVTDAKIDSTDLGTGLSGAGENIYYLSPGQHTLSCTGTSNYPSHLDASSTFTVASCPWCPACPNGGSVDPISGTCCQGGSCDVSLYRNFGPLVYSGCNTARGGSLCLNQNPDSICGGSVSGCLAFASTSQALAVRFVNTLSTPKTVRRIWLPLYHVQGTNSYTVVVAQDANGVPGAALESISLANIQAYVSLPVSVALSVESSAHPSLAAGAAYWLVILPGDADTWAYWFAAPLDMGTSTNYLDTRSVGANNVPTLNGPWAPRGSQAPLRPAFAIDVI
jgi:hypothetical protein